jgi:hypothetical protein
MAMHRIQQPIKLITPAKMHYTKKLNEVSFKCKYAYVYIHTLALIPNRSYDHPVASERIEVIIAEPLDNQLSEV